MSPHALVVDDEPRMAELMGLALESHGFTWSGARDADEALEVLINRQVDLLVLDVMLPGESGLDLCRRIRASSSLPIILVSALGTTDERIAGLEAGADDYVPKPFSPRELALRAQALVRREPVRPDPPPDALRRDVGALSLDAGTLQLTVAGRRVHVSAGEFKMLWLLAEHPGRTVSWQELFAVMADAPSVFGGQRAVRTAIYRLRTKLGDSPQSPQHLLTDRGRGYRLAGGGHITGV
ncbi:MAG: response regulator transcription factor [Propionibacteriaceae bacterium]|nr:response regulator transcription factor [Propionibacteriaceae bacterium]